MSRTKSGYFVSPLTQVERDLIWEHFEPYSDKKVQLEIYNQFYSLLNKVMDDVKGEAFLSLHQICHELNTEVIPLREKLYSEYRSKELLLDGLFAFEVSEERAIVPTQALYYLSMGEYPFKDKPTVKVSPPQGLSPIDLQIFLSREDELIEFANSHFDLFKLPC